MKNRDVGGFGDGDAREFHNDPKAHFDKQEEDRRDASATTHLYSDEKVYSAVIISDNGETYGGTYERIIKNKKGDEAKYVSFFVRFYGPQEDVHHHPDASKPNPLHEFERDKFLTMRSLNRSRAVMNSTFFQSTPAIGTIVTCRNQDGLWKIVEDTGIIHDAWTNYVAGDVPGGTVRGASSARANFQ